MYNVFISGLFGDREACSIRISGHIRLGSMLASLEVGWGGVCRIRHALSSLIIKLVNQVVVES